MYAFIANEYRTIVHSQRQLDFLISIYSYPKFAKVSSTEEANNFFRKYDREFLVSGCKMDGRMDKVGYLSIEYFIDKNTIYSNIVTTNFGFIKFGNVPSNVKASFSYDLIKLKFENVALDDELIAHHCIAIQNILRVVGDLVNIELRLPDLSIYLALTKYTGSNFAIRNTQNMIKNRFGNVYYTIIN